MWLFSPKHIKKCFFKEKLFAFIYHCRISLNYLWNPLKFLWIHRFDRVTKKMSGLECLWYLHRFWECVKKLTFSHQKSSKPLFFRKKTQKSHFLQKVFPQKRGNSEETLRKRPILKSALTLSPNRVRCEYRTLGRSVAEMN